MFRYSTTEEIILNTEWIAMHGEQWRCGRIEVNDTRGSWYHNEYTLEPMHWRSWEKLSDWLWDFTSTYDYTKEQLLSLFERNTQHKIEWWKE